MTAAALPDLDAVPAEALPDLARKVLQETGPAILRRMASLGRSYEQGAAGQLDVLAAELEFQQFIAFARRLYRHAADLVPETTGMVRPEHDRLEGVVRLAYSPDSPFLVHGPILLGRIGMLAEALLRPGESLRALRDTRFRRPVFHDVLVTLSAGRPPEPAKTAAVGGRFETSGDRDIWFEVSEQADAPVAAWFDNDFATAMIGNIGSAGDGGVVFKLLPPAKPVGRELLASGGGRLQLVLDALVHLALMVRGQGGRAILLSAVEHCIIPPRRFFVSPRRAAMKVDSGAVTGSRSGFSQVPVVFRHGTTDLLRLVFAERRTTVCGLFAALSPTSS